MLGFDITGWPGWRVDFAWMNLPRLAAYKRLYDGAAGTLAPGALYDLAVLAGLPEDQADALREARASVLFEEALEEG